MSLKSGTRSWIEWHDSQSVSIYCRWKV